MTARREFFEHAATVLSYPGKDFRESVRRMGDALAGEPPDASAAGLVRAFATEMNRLTDTQLEELYTRTFDLTPEISLETGWQLYGEAYERGSFLVAMRKMLRDLGIAETGELPDHLTYLLRAVGRLPADEGRELVGKYLSKSLAKILDRFPQGDNPYRKLLEAISVVFENSSTMAEDAKR